MTPPTASEMLKRLEADGLIERGPRKAPLLTKRGREEAERVVRHHRVIERFLTDFMGYTAAESHVHADELGDAFSDEMVERLAVQLGQPDRCPHGWPVDTAHEQEENRELRALAQVEPRVPHASCASPSTTATCSTGSTSRASCRAPTSRSRAPTPSAGQLTVRIGGEERAIGERAAAGLYVLPG